MKNIQELVGSIKQIQQQSQIISEAYQKQEFAKVTDYGLLHFEYFQHDAKLRSLFLQAAIQSQDWEKALCAVRMYLSTGEIYPEFLNLSTHLFNDLQAAKQHGVMYSLACMLCESIYKNSFTYSLLGAALLLNSRFVEAKEVLELAVKTFPPCEKVLTNLGYAYQALNLRRESIAVLTQALEVNANVKETYVNLSNAYHAIGQLERAEAVLKQGLQKFPQFHLLHSNVAGLLYTMQKKEEALEAALKAHELDNDAIEPITIIIEIYRGTQRLGKALEFCRQHLQRLPNEQSLWSIYGMCLRDLGRVQESVEANIKALSLPNAKKADAARHIFTPLLFSLNYHADMSARDIYAYYEQFNQTFYAHIPRIKQNVSDERKCLLNGKVTRKLKVGYVSQHFTNQVSKYFLIPLFENHDRSQFEIYLYSSTSVQDQVTEQYMKLADRWVNTAQYSDYQLAQKIVEDEIDVLVDTAGHTNGNRLGVFAFKPAPVSLHWLDFGYTTGMPSIDYYLTDKAGVTENCQPIFAEKLWLLDGAAYAYRPIDYAEGVNPSPLPYDKNGFITFGCLSRAIRINHKVIHVWAVILKSVPHSVLMLNSGDFSDPSIVEDYFQQFEAHGVSRNRIKIGFDTPSWKPMQEIDIMLDCFPHNSGMTLIESLYMGLPYITLASRPSVGLIGSSILHAAGMPDWIAKTEREYANKAIQAAHQPDGLRTLRANLRGMVQQSLLMNEKAFALSMENAYREMWRKFCEKSAIESQIPQQ